MPAALSPLVRGLRPAPRRAAPLGALRTLPYVAPVSPPPGYAGGGKIPAAAAKWLRRAGPNEYRWLGNYPVPRSVASNLYDPTAERYLWGADVPELAIKDTRRRATDADPRVKDWYTNNLFERLARAAPDAPLHPDFANPETGEIYSWANNLNPQLLNMRHPLELTRKGDYGPDWLARIMLRGDSEATLGALTRWALGRYAKMGPGEYNPWAAAQLSRLVSDPASYLGNKNWKTDLTPERMEGFRETARRTAPVIKELRPQLNALAKKWYGGKRGMWGNALAAAYEHFNVPAPRGLYTGPLMQVSMQSYVNPFYYEEPSREPYPSLAEKLFERYPAVADAVGDATLNQVLTHNQWNDAHPLSILSMQLENGQLRPEAFTKNRLPFLEGLARVGRYDAAAVREAAARRENTEAAQRAKAAELQRQVSKDVLALPADYDTGEFRFSQLPSHGRAPTPEDLDLTCRVGESMKYCLARRATAEQYLRESDHFLMHNAEGYPIALVEVKPTPYGPRVMQVQGYGNTVPRPEHRDVIADFLLKSVKPYDILSNALAGSGLRANPDWFAQLGHAPRWIKNTPDPDAE